MWTARTLQLPMGECMAEVLNLLLDSDLTAATLGFAIGRRPVRMVQLNRRVSLAECWHFPEGELQQIAWKLASSLGGSPGGSQAVSVLSCAICFGAVGALLRSGRIKPEEKVDIAGENGSLFPLIGGLYAKALGLPVGKILVVCNENDKLWELWRYGRMHTGSAAVETWLPAMDVVVPPGLETLLCLCGGQKESIRFSECCCRGTVYEPDERTLQHLRALMRVCVVGSQRMSGALRAGAAAGYLHTPYSAAVYAGWQEHCISTEAAAHCLILSQRSPELETERIAGILGKQKETIGNMLSSGGAGKQ